MRRAFTLIELLVVISIIGLLTAILIPSLSGARDQSKSVVCQATLRSLGSSFFAYATDNQGYLCSGQADARPGMNLPSQVTDLGRTGIDKIGWIADLVNQVGTFPGLMLCPGNPGTRTQSWKRALLLPGATAAYPAAGFELLTTKQGFNTNYCQSWYMVHTQYDGTTSPVFDHDRMKGSIGPLRIAKMANAGASRVPLLGDARAAKDEHAGGGAQGYGARVRETKSVTDGPGWLADEDGSFTMVPYSSLNPYGSQDWDDFGPAHRRKSGLRNDEGDSLVVGNILFGDAHVASFRDRYDFDNGIIKNGPDGELDSWDLRTSEVFDGVLSLGRRSRSSRKLE